MRSTTTSIILVLGLTAHAGPARSQDVQLCDLGPNLDVGDWEFMPIQIHIGGRLFQDYGFAGGTARFVVDGFDRFWAFAGVNDHVKDSAEILIRLENREVWRGVVRSGEPAKRININLTGFHEMAISGTLSTCVLAEPRLVRFMGDDVRMDENGNVTSERTGGGGPAPMPGAGNPAPATTPPPVRPRTTVIPVAGPLARHTLYTNSFALLVAAGEYANQPHGTWRPNAVKDVNAIRDALISTWGFPPGNITILANQSATLANVQAQLAALQDPEKVQKRDRVLFYFTGLAATAQPADGKPMGYLFPTDATVGVDAPTGTLDGQCLSLKDLWQTLWSCPARQCLMLVDACTGGFDTLEPADVKDLAPDDLLRAATRPARQLITAGAPGEVCPDDPALGHSPFAAKLLGVLEQTAASEASTVTAGQLFGALRREVAAATGSRLTPQMARSTTEGEFVFARCRPFASATPKPGEAGATGEAVPQQGPNGHWYAAVAEPDGSGWSTARDTAAGLTYHGLKGHLATVTSAAEQKFIADKLPDAVRKCFWLGGYQDLDVATYKEPDGGWRWVTTEPWEYANWNHGFAQEPNNATGQEDFLCFISNGGWNDQRGDAKVPGYIVEYEPEATAQQK